MKYRTLGKTGLRVSVVGVGTWQFGGEWGKDFEQPEATAMIRRAGELGVNLIDTAECYGDHLSERLVGGAVAELGRDDWVIATKFGHKFHGYMDRTEPRSPDDVRTQLENSLKSLRTDVIDVYQYHSWGDDRFFDDEVLAVLHEAKRAGKVKHLANSVGPNDKIEQIDASADRGIEAIQIVYNRLDRKPEHGPLDACLRQNLGVLARVPLASGFLSGKYGPGDADQFQEGDVRSNRDPAQIRKQLEEVERIGRDEVPDGVPMARWALAWCLQHPAVSCVIPGCKSVEQVEANAAAADLELVSGDHPQAVGPPS